MYALFALVLTATPQCFQPSDNSPGWKQVTLPPGVERLAAPEGVEQFRTDEAVDVVDEPSALYLAGSDDGLGVVAFEFDCREGARSLELRFKDSLRGAKVDAVAQADGGAMRLLDEQRVGGRTLSLAWGMRDVKWVKVRVHHHTRPAPVLDGYTSVRRVSVSRLGISPAFQLAHSLYYYQPTAQSLSLCVEPDRVMKLKPNSPRASDVPTPVSLLPMR